MEILNKDDGKKGQFYIEKDGKVIAETTYVWSGPQRIIIDHTEVDESLKGKNIGKQLVHKVVLFAREKHIKVMPLCPFAKAVFDKTPDYQDVVF
jgi:uncharacterized protein